MPYEMAMPFSANPEQLSILQQVFEDQCRETGMPLNDPRRKELASELMALFGHGAQSIDELKAGLFPSGQYRPASPGQRG